MLLCLLISKLGNLESLFGRLLKPQVAVRLRNLRYYCLNFADLFSFRCFRFRFQFCLF